MNNHIRKPLTIYTVKELFSGQIKIDCTRRGISELRAIRYQSSELGGTSDVDLKFMSWVRPECRPHRQTVTQTIN